MARKSSDLFSLLATRGGNRRGGIFGQVAGAIGSMFHSKRTQPGPRRVVMSGLGFLAVCFVCGGIGYLLGDQFPMSPARQVLRANPDVGKSEGQKPGPIDNPSKPKPATKNAFYVGNFDDDRAKADELTEYLKGQGVARASTYGVVRKGEKGDQSNQAEQKIWLVVVYFDTAKEEEAMRRKLRTLQAPAKVPMFETWRSTKDWPIPTVL